MIDKARFENKFSDSSTEFLSMKQSSSNINGSSQKDPYKKLKINTTFYAKKNKLNGFITSKN